MKKVIHTSMIHAKVANQDMIYMVATCDDGTMWYSYGAPRAQTEWKQLPGIQSSGSNPKIGNEPGFQKTVEVHTKRP